MSDSEWINATWERLTQPLHWRKPRRVLVNDLFRENVPDEYIDRAFAVMAATSRHRYQVLSKHPEQMREYLANPSLSQRLAELMTLSLAMEGTASDSRQMGRWKTDGFVPLPLPNVWLGVSAENQRWADKRIPILLSMPAAMRFVSCEPLLGPISLRPYLPFAKCSWDSLDDCIDCIGVGGTREACGMHRREGLSWVIAGGESAGPENRRLVERCPDPDLPHVHDELDSLAENCPGIVPKPEALAWVRSLRNQCAEAGVPFFWKQWGGARPKSGGRLLDGRTWDEFPS
jgi:protein gp37